VAALWLRFALQFELGTAPGYAIFTVPVMLAAIAGGLRTGLLATALSSLGMAYFVLPPIHSLSIATSTDRWQNGLFVFAGVILSMAVEALHRARRQAEVATNDHARSQQALEKSEAVQRELAARMETETARLVAAQAVAKMGSFETNLSDQSVSWSDEMHHIFETDPATFRPTLQSFLVLVHPDDRAAVAAATGRFIGPLAIQMIEHRLVMADGRIKFVSVQWQAFYDNGDVPQRLIGTCQDVTAQRLSEASIRLQAHMLDNVGQAVIGTDARGTITYANQFVKELYGWSPDEILGKDILDVTVGREGRRDAEQIMSTLQLGSKWNGEFVVRHRDGREFAASVTNAPLRGEHGDIIGVVGISEDITARNRVAAELRASVSEISRTNRALKMLSNCNEVIARAQGEVEFLKQICQIAVDHGGYRMAWVGYAEHNVEQTISPVASAGVDDGYLTQAGISWNAGVPEGLGPAGQIIRSGKAVTCRDIRNDPAFEPWHTLAEERGYRGFVGMPLREGARTFGLLALYSGEVYESTPDEMALLEEMADSVAFGIVSLRAQSERRVMEAAVLKVAAGVTASSGLEFFEQLACSMAQALGAHAAYVAQILPGDPRTVRTLAAFAGGSFAANFDFVVAGTPCDMIPDTDSVVITDHVADKFPHLPRLTELGGRGYVCQRLDGSSGSVLGFVFVVFQQPLERIEFIRSTLKIFAARAASELERGETEVRLREQAALMDIAYEGIQVKDLDGRVVYWNKGAERIYGWTAAEIIGRVSTDILYQDPAAFQAAHAILLASGAWQGEMIKLTKDGRAITVEVRWTLVRDGRGNPKSILAINTDVTQRRKLESQSRRAQRMESIGTLAGGIAHDLNNVLAPILMSVETLKGAVSSEADLALLGTLQGSAQRGADLVKQLLAFAKGVEGQRINVDPAFLIREFLTVVRDTFPKSIAVRFSPPSDAWTIVGDPTQMHQVLLNLCVNARDAMPDGGTLTLGTKNVVLDSTSDGVTDDCPAGRYLLISVTDTGTGISSENRSRVFEPFFTTKDLEKGTGLGLSTSLAIVKSHHGFIRLTSSATGTTFHVYFPARRVSQAAARVAASPPAPLHGNGELVLLVDDDEAIRKVAQRLLERFGYRVVVAANGQQAVEMYERQRAEIAIVITDMSMPVMDGPATVRALRAMNPEVRIIVSSGLTSDAAVAEATGCAVRHFMSKPYTAQAMLQTLHAGLTASSNN
jgi:PAS domain S-box-containing protein